MKNNRGAHFKAGFRSLDLPHGGKMTPADDDEPTESTAAGEQVSSPGFDVPAEPGDVAEYFEMDADSIPIDDEIVEHENANTNSVGADIEREHQQKIRRWTLVLIGSLIAFCVAATLFVTVMASNDTEAQVAGDIAKLTVPTLLTLLGATVAWAYRRNGD